MKNLYLNLLETTKKILVEIFIKKILGIIIAEKLLLYTSSLRCYLK